MPGYFVKQKKKCWVWRKKINLNTNKTAHEEINGQIVGGNLRSCICWRIIIVLNGKHDLLDSIARLSINVSLTTWQFAIGLVITSSQTPKTNIPTPIQITSCHRNNSRINGVCSIELCYLFWQFPTKLHLIQALEMCLRLAVFRVAGRMNF